MDKAKKVIVVVFINIFLITLILYGFEFLFSPYTDPPINGKVEGKRYTWGHMVRENKYGFRERDFKNPKPSELYRVMVLGDSFTWGVGLAVEERYTAIAEKLLNRHFYERKFEVLNFGINGAPTIRERDILQKFIGVIDPDLIVVGFCLNDPQPKLQNYSMERVKLRKSVIGRIIREISREMRYVGLHYIGELLYDIFYRSAEVFGLIPTWQTALQRTYEPLSKEWKEFVQALKDIKSISDESNLPPPILAILNQGVYKDRPTDYNNPDEKLKQYLQWYHQVEKTAKDIGFTANNHEYEIAHQLKNEPLAVNVIDGHPSAKLNRIYGEKLHQAIAKQTGVGQ